MIGVTTQRTDSRFQARPERPASISFLGVRIELNGKAIVDELTLTIGRGEVFGFLGRSGSGKTTLLNSVAGFIKPAAGQVMRTRKGALRPAIPNTDIGYVFQDIALFPSLTARENIGFGLESQRLPRSKIIERVNEMARLFEITAFLDRDPNSLSGGEKQRVAIARSFAPAPAFYLLDEPFSQLDYQLKGRIQRRIYETLKLVKSTCIIVSHDFLDCALLCDRIAVLERGRIAQVDRPAAVYRNPSSVAVGLITGDLVAFGGVEDGSRADVIDLYEEGSWEGRRIVACRPENIRLGVPAAQTAVSFAAHARVKDVRDLGSISEVQLETEHGKLFGARTRWNPSLMVGDLGSSVSYYIAERDAIRFCDGAREVSICGSEI